MANNEKLTKNEQNIYRKMAKRQKFLINENIAGKIVKHGKKSTKIAKICRKKGKKVHKISEKPKSAQNSSKTGRKMIKKS